MPEISPYVLKFGWTKTEELSNALLRTKNDLIHWALQKDEDGDTPIHLSVVQGNDSLCLYLCRLLLSEGLHIDIRNKIMQTPLHIACITGNSKLVQNLLDLDTMSLNKTDRNGNTCIHLAVKHDGQSCETLRGIMKKLPHNNERRTIVNKRNIHGYSALHFASSINKPEAIKLLIAHGAEINQAETKSGKSPLYLAVQEKNGESVKVLLELGADSNCTTYFRDSPSQLASNQDQKCMLRIMSRYDLSSESYHAPDRGSKVANLIGNQNLQLKKDNIETDDQRKEDVIVKADPNENDMTHSHRNVEGSSVQASTIKEEYAFPTSTSQLPMSSEPSKYVQNPLLLAEDKEKLRELDQAREQVLKTIESFSRLKPGVIPALNGLGFSSSSLAADAASLHNPKQIYSSIYGNPGALLPQPRDIAIERFGGFARQSGLSQGKDMTTFFSNLNWLPFGSLGVLPTGILSETGSDKESDNTGSSSKTGSETTCVMDKPTMSKAVSISGANREKASNEPLDLSQNRQDPVLPSESPQSVDRDKHENKTLSNMLIDSATKVGAGIHPISGKPPSAEVGENIKIKTEVLDEKDTEGKTFMRSTERTEENTDTKPSPFITGLSLQNGTNHRLPETLIPFSNSWVDARGSICNPQIFLPPAAFGYFPRNPLDTLATYHPAKLAQSSHAAGIAAGLSHWVNLSLDVVRAVEQIRQIPGATADTVDIQSPRKRKFGLEENNSVYNKPESTTLGNTSAKTESIKRMRLHESLSDGMRRSVSDDQARCRQLETDKKHKRVLERRNSAPSSSVVNQILRQEDEKRIAPVDLHSYTGCLPPHYLHLLQSSGNLPVTWREHALREVADVYDSSRDKEDSKGLSRLRMDVPNNIHDLGSRMKSGISASKSQSVASSLTPSSSRYQGKAVVQPRELWRPAIPTAASSQNDLGNCSSDSSHAQKSLGDRLNYFDETQRRKLIDYYQSIGHTSGFVERSLKRSEAEYKPERVRKVSETESDDDDYIQTLQISDASDDEDLKTEIYERSRPVIKARNSQESHIAFGEGPWRSMDNGLIHAFASCTANTTTQRETTDKEPAASRDWFTPPTKLACSVKDIIAQPVNGTMRSYCTSKSLNTTRGISHTSKGISSEFLPHDVISGSEKCLESIAPRMIQKTSTTRKSSKCPGCSGSRDKHCRGYQDDDTRKLLGDIFRQSFGRNRKNTCLTTITNSQPRLVFSSDIADLSGSAKDFSQSYNQLEESKLISTSIEKSEGRQVDGHSRQMLNCSKENRVTQNIAISNCSVSMRKSEGKRLVSEKPYPPEQSSIRESLRSLPATTTHGTGQKKDFSSSSTSSRLSSLDAKLEELLQKAVLANEITKKAGGASEMDKDCTMSEVSSIRSQEENRSMDSNIKTEHIARVSENVLPAPSTNQKSHLANHTVEESRSRSRLVSPFVDTESGRYVTKRNVAVIKPNQSLTEKVKRKDESSAYVCPPKKRHFKRYSPDLYSRMQKNVSPNHNREVKSASPVTRPSSIASEEESLKNVRWCSPDRGTSAKNPQGVRSKTVLSYHFPRNMAAIRTSGSRAIMIENYRKFPRYVTSPRSDAVIVIESRLPGKLADNREDERLEICDLEISDDEC